MSEWERANGIVKGSLAENLLQHWLKVSQSIPLLNCFDSSHQFVLSLPAISVYRLELDGLNSEGTNRLP